MAQDACKLVAGGTTARAAMHHSEAEEGRHTLGDVPAGGRRRAAGGRDGLGARGGRGEGGAPTRSLGT